MWYFIWILGVRLALSAGLLSALWGEHEEGRQNGSKAE